MIIVSFIIMLWANVVFVKVILFQGTCKQKFILYSIYRVSRGECARLRENVP